MVSSCQATLPMMSSGEYDEALSVTRSLGEIVNLVGRFVAAESELKR